MKALELPVAGAGIILVMLLNEARVLVEVR